MTVITHMREYDCPPSLANPRSPRGNKKINSNFEKWAWLFMRFSGMLLVFLALGHVFIMLAWDSNGVHRINAAFIAHRWHEPLWQLWDVTMLWLAELHGANGMRVIIADYTQKNISRFWFNALLLISAIIVITLGTYALITFNPSNY